MPPGNTAHLSRVFFFADVRRFPPPSPDFHRHPPILRANMPPPAPFCRRSLKIKTPHLPEVRFSHTFFEACRRPHSFPFADRTCRAVFSPIPLFLQRNSFCKSRKHPVSSSTARSLREFRCFYNVIRFVNPENTQFPRPPRGFPRIPLF